MIVKLIFFYLILRLTGNPILGIVLILFLYYVLDRRFLGLLPNVLTPMRRMRQISVLRRQTALNPHDAPARMSLARVYIEQRKYQTALAVLQTIPEALQESTSVLYDRGLCLLHMGQVDSGESLVLRVLRDNPSYRYGEPWLRLAQVFASVDPTKALQYLQECRVRNSSSCEADYRIARLLLRSGDKQGASAARDRCLHTYRTLPRFRKRSERRWALLALLSRA